MKVAFHPLSPRLVREVATQSWGSSSTPAAARRQVDSADNRLAEQVVRVDARNKCTIDGVEMEAYLCLKDFEPEPLTDFSR